MDIEQELLQAVDVKAQGKKEDEQKYLKRLTKAIAKLGDDDFEELSEEAQDWYNDAADAVNDDDEIPAFDEEEEEEEEELDFDSIEDGQFIKVELEEEDVLGEVIKVTGSSLFLDVEGEKTRIKLDDIYDFSEAKRPRKGKKKKGKKKGGDKKEGGLSLGKTVQKLIAQHPKFSIEKIEEKLEKSGIEFTPATIKAIYQQCHTFLEFLEGAGWSKSS